MGGDEPRRPHQEAIALIQLDWDGNEVWRYDGLEQVVTEESKNDIFHEKRIRGTDKSMLEEYDGPVFHISGILYSMHFKNESILSCNSVCFKTETA